MIPLIHNYYDRWCERCTITSQCNVYEKTAHLSEDDLDIKNENFWELLQDTLEKSLMLLQKKMKEMNIPSMTKQESVEFEKQEEQKIER